MAQKDRNKEGMLHGEALAVPNLYMQGCTNHENWLAENFRNKEVPFH